MPPFPSLQPKPHLPVTPILPNQIYVVDNFLSQKELRSISAWTQSLELEGPKRPAKGEAERTGRRASVQSPEIASTLLSLLSPYLSQITPEYTSPNPACSPNIRVYHYPPKTFFGQHYDMPQLDLKSRRLSCWTVLVYLSDGVKGGETIFYPHEDTGKRGKKGKGAGTKKGPTEKISVEPKAGRMLLHWHGVSGGGCMRHEGGEVLVGDKWVLRTDVLA